MGRMKSVESTEPSGWVEKGKPPSRLRRTRVGYSALMALMAMILLLVLYAGTLMAKAGSPSVPDFSVDTYQGKFTFSEHRGEILVYFFSFPG